MGILENTLKWYILATITKALRAKQYFSNETKDFTERVQRQLRAPSSCAAY